jgi:hypothetical protein
MRWCQTLGQKAGLIANLTIPHWAVCVVPAMAVGECDAKGHDHRTRRQDLRSSRDPDVKRLEGSHFRRRHPANGFTYSVDSEVYQDAAIDGVPEDLVAGLMETAERDFRRGLTQELVTAEKATDDDIAVENDKFKP